MLRQGGLLSFAAAVVAWSQDPGELVRRSIAQDRNAWLRMKDYTWQATLTQRQFDSLGRVKSMKVERWDTVIVDGRVHKRILERNGQPLRPENQHKEQERLDQASRKLPWETPAERPRHLDEDQIRSARAWALFSEIPDLFDLRLEAESILEGKSVWIVSGMPRPNARPKSRDGKLLLNIRGRLWIDQTTYQWVRVEAETTGVISWGLFLARLDTGSKMIFEQAEVGSSLFPKRLFLIGSGRIGLVKRLVEDQELDWSNYKRFSVDSKIVSESPNPNE